MLQQTPEHRGGGGGGYGLSFSSTFLPWISTASSPHLMAREGPQRAPAPNASSKRETEKCRRDRFNQMVEELELLVPDELNEIGGKRNTNNILSAAVRKVRKINEKRVSDGNRHSPVQESDVSSSRGCTFDNNYMVHLLLKRYEAFILSVTRKGIIEEVTGGVKEILNYRREELIRNSIYNFVADADKSIVAEKVLAKSQQAWDLEKESSNNSKRECNLTFLRKPNPEEEGTDKHKPYEPMQVATFLNNVENGGSSDNEVILCLAQKINCISGEGKDPLDQRMVSQFTTRLNLPESSPVVKVIEVDTHGLDELGSELKQLLKDKNYLEFCHPDDRDRVKQKFTELQHSNNSTTCEGYRFSFRNSHMWFNTMFTRFSDSVLATHSILGEEGTNSCIPQSTGDLLPDIRLDHSAWDHLQLVQTSGQSPFHSGTSNPPSVGASAGNISRPSSRQSSTSNPSRPAISPIVQNSPHHGPPTPFASFSPPGNEGEAGGPRTPHDKKDTKEVNSDSDSVVTTPDSWISESARLRTILTQPSGEEMTEVEDKSNRNKILKGLLNQDTSSDESASKNKVLLKMLNKSTDEPESKVRDNKLLAQLLNDTECKSESSAQAGQQALSDTILKEIEGSGGRVKRPSQDDNGPPSKQPMFESQIQPSSKASPRQNNNKMLLALLKSPASTPISINYNPELVSQIPQSKLPNPQDLEQKIRPEVSSSHWSGGSVTRTTESAAYLNTILSARQQQVGSDGTALSGDSSEFDIIEEIASLQNDFNQAPFTDNDSAVELEPSVHSVIKAEETEAIKAIKQITQNLMACETQATSTTPHQAAQYTTTQTSRVNYPGHPPPPVYPGQGRYTRAPTMVRSTVPSQYQPATATMQTGARQVRQSLIQDQKQNLQRLLEQQRKQQLVPITNPLLQNSEGMEDYAPNVTLQRSSSVPADPQLSPNYTGNTMMSSPTQRGPYSPHSPLTSQPPFSSPQSGMTGYGGTTQQNAQSHRMSPLLPTATQHYSQSQLSPRPHPTQTVPAKFGTSAQSPGAPAGTWAQSPVSGTLPLTTSVRTTLIQQNPMLNARLSTTQQQATYTNSQYPTQSAVVNVRGMRSPSPRQTHYSTMDAYQQQRIQRALSSPASPAGHMGTPSYYPSPDPPLTPSYHPTSAEFHYDQQALQQHQQQQQQQRILSPPQAGGMTSEFVRQQLRATAEARNQLKSGRADLGTADLHSLFDDGNSITSPPSRVPQQLLEDTGSVQQRNDPQRQSLLKQLLQD